MGPAGMRAGANLESLKGTKALLIKQMPMRAKGEGRPVTVFSPALGRLTHAGPRLWPEGVGRAGEEGAQGDADGIGEDILKAGDAVGQERLGEF